MSRHDISEPLLSTEKSKHRRVSASLKLWSGFVGFLLGGLAPISVGKIAQEASRAYLLQDTTNALCWILIIILGGVGVTSLLFAWWFALLRCCISRQNKRHGDNGLAESLMLQASPVLFAGMALSFCILMGFPPVMEGILLAACCFTMCLANRNNNNHNNESIAEHEQETSILIV